MRGLPLWVINGGSQPISSCSPTVISKSACLNFNRKLGFASTKCGSWYPLAIDSTLIRSPPTSCASAAMSVVAVITFSFLACAANGNRSNATKANIRFIQLSLKRMRAVRAQRKDQLHQELVAVSVLSILRETIFSTNLAEFAWPVSQRGGKALVGQIVELAPVRPVKPSTCKPAPAELIVAGG